MKSIGLMFVTVCVYYNMLFFILSCIYCIAVARLLLHFISSLAQQSN